MVISSAVVLLVRVILLPQFGCWVPVLDMTGADCGVGRGCSWLAKAVKGKGICWCLGRAVDVIFDVADLQGSRRCWDYR